MSISTDHFSRENAESDSDDNSDVAADDYQPISALDDHDSDTESNGPDLIEHSSEYHVQNPNLRNYSNGIYQAENGISSLDLSSSNGGGFNGCDETDEEEEEEEEERLREAAERAVSRAFREDERRRNAPLTPENASRIVDVMRGVSFRGFAPDWADRVPDDQWMDRLRRLREPTS
ncbi:hypothetical protein MRB53_003913 [Persea americana]|uniref:Uncharacterized protein n=1 Tax=Persea americana TaxID=3435 RepID=A0ACC2MYR5_PERAE|nr:hypothetical protein MRB53_003913 [Persea americana]|eukprot:TRINITY_DN6082_c0_g1_i1.p1 TRINITY_DN6082_c0_g1~~TRINITY_DN6082_c0_g1_i1.p1  ORF type:complete len:176 (-),score=23.91 TRINITY_DN6082_c0_g1_i1:778-1305(-)